MAAPARSEAAKYSTGVSRDGGGLDGEDGSRGGGEDVDNGWSLKAAMACSMRALKKKKDAQLLALPMMLGVRPR